MLIWVLHEDGKRELITLTEPISIKQGLHFDRLTFADGSEHWFTKDGFYDGWGQAMNGVSEEEATEIVLQVESARHIEGESG